ncbi:Uncharacterised protein [Leminorella richardii]|uniref:Uncharacterized protein n=1 Tax=Leminorella richardii TaxID=158841 RepID=A0A2X4UQN2_9GAMM|nr:hypothetical protein [Leminorella richardii]SQI41101.1 Uncharacterised protein [Leminorella richardii]
MKRRLILTLSAAFGATLVLAACIYLFYVRQQESFSCASHTTYLFEKSDKSNEALMISSMKFRFKNGKGKNVMTGYIETNGQRYTIDRTISFDYYRNKNNDFTLNTTNVLRTSHDTLPKDLGERYLYRFSTELHESTYLHMIEMSSGKRLFSSGTLPYFICE